MDIPIEAAAHAAVAGPVVAADLGQAKEVFVEMPSRVSRRILFYNRHTMTNEISKKGNVHLVGVQTKYRSKVGESAIKGLNTAAKLLKYKKAVDVAIFDAEAWDIHPKMSLSAHARVYYIDIKMCFYRTDIDVKEMIDIELPLTIQHEFSHVVRANTVGYPETLLDAVIDEGIACYVEQFSKPDRNIPYLTKHAKETLYLENAKKLFDNKISTELHNEWFFGGKKLPEWIGYRLGFLIVQKFMENNPTALDVLCRTSSKDILKGSKL